MKHETPEHEPVIHGRHAVRDDRLKVFVVDHLLGICEILKTLEGALEGFALHCAAELLEKLAPHSERASGALEERRKMREKLEMERQKLKQMEEARVEAERLKEEKEESERQRRKDEERMIEEKRKEVREIFQTI